MVTEVKISELPAASSANGTMEFETNDSGTSKKVTGTQLATYVRTTISPGSYTRVVTEFTATAGQTSFTPTGGYTAGYIDVEVNGASLPTADYTASNGTTVVLATGCVAGDVVRIVAWTTFNVANTYTSAQVDANFASLTGVQTLTNKTLTNPTVTNYVETLYAPAAGSAFTVSLANGTLQKLTTNANTTITLPASSAGKSFALIVAYGGAHTITWAGGSTIKWSGGTAPTATSASGKFDIFVFTQDGTNTYGRSGGSNF